MSEQDARRTLFSEHATDYLFGLLVKVPHGQARVPSPAHGHYLGPRDECASWLIAGWAEGGGGGRCKDPLRAPQGLVVQYTGPGDERMDIQILKACATGWQGKQGKQYKVFREAWVSWFINSTLVMHCLVLSMMCIKMVCTNPSAPEEDHPLPVVILIAFTVVIAMRWLLKACNLPQYILSVNYAIRYFEAFYFIAFILGYVQSDLIIHNKVMVPLVDVNMALMDGVGLQITVPQALAFFPLRVVVMIYAVSAIQGCNMAAVSHSLEAQVSNIQACSWPGDLSAAQLFQIFGSTITFLAVSFGHEYRCCKEFLRKQMFSVEATRSRSSSLNPRSVLGSFTEGSDVANVALMAAPAGPSCMAASVLPSIMAASVMPSSMAPAEEPSVIAAQEEPSSLPSIMAAPEVPSVMAASVMPSTIASQEEPSFLPSIMAAPEVPSIMAASVMPSTIAAQEEPSALPSVMAALEPSHHVLLLLVLLMLMLMQPTDGVKPPMRASTLFRGLAPHSCAEVFK
eukprot:gene17641-23984_t